jgi:hypothetical protein
MSSSFPNRQELAGRNPALVLAAPPTPKFTAGAASSTDHRSQVLGISGTVMIPANILHHHSCVVSPAEFEVFTWRHQRAVDCLWAAAIALLASEPLWIIGGNSRSALASVLLRFTPVTVLAAAVLLFGLLRKRGHRLSTVGIKETPDGWTVRYSFRGFFRRIHRQRIFVNECAAKSFLQN